MTENMKKFLELASKDEELFQKADKLGFSVEKIIALAAQYGVTLSESDFPGEKAVALDDDALDNISGGSITGNNGLLRNLMFSYNTDGKSLSVQNLPVNPGQVPNPKTMEFRPDNAADAQTLGFPSSGNGIVSI